MRYDSDIVNENTIYLRSFSCDHVITRTFYRIGEKVEFSPLHELWRESEYYEDIN